MSSLASGQRRRTAVAMTWAQEWRRRCKSLMRSRSARVFRSGSFLGPSINQGLNFTFPIVIGPIRKTIGNRYRMDGSDFEPNNSLPPAPNAAACVLQQSADNDLG